MIDLLSRIAVKYHYALKHLLVHTQRKLFFRNTKSKIHDSFKLGGDNVLDISPEAIFEIAENVTLNSNNFITVKKNARLKIGKETYITRATISCLGEIEIGENCILGEGMKLFDHNHQYTTNPFSVSKTDFNIGKIKIGNNVWTGANVTILKGVTIGDNCIIGTGVLVYKDVPDNSLVTLKQELQIKQL
ncbi:MULTISPECIES: DapH/DapD/GlmU-related protein [unclassified Kaistella]|uniref:acyltransferase n=1 Tax=unclassified Kaistella TaxID=2762626 RepID=UPI00273546BA|nr:MULTISPECIES: acyltransferase [unclassified Kaistella]MDP2454938.1 acyltransferase [Kaistella sp. SH11-4b]MDP2456079.1 acyltransferase [Kaistella sp. SH40-3]MDP2460608.1 acyltransferase [Kaistella sp. SH19-2b]